MVWNAYVLGSIKSVCPHPIPMIGNINGIPETYRMIIHGDGILQLQHVLPETIL